MVLAAGGDGTHHTFEAQRIQLGLCEVEVFVTPTRLLTGHDLAFAEALLRSAHAFNCEHRRLQAAHIKHLAHFLFRAGALTFGVNFFQHFLDNRRPWFGTVLHHDGAIAFGTVGNVLHIRLGTGPPHAVHLVARVAGGLRFFQGGGVHHAPAPVEHIVWLVLADLQPGGFLLHARVGDRQQGQGEAVHLGALFQHRNRLFAKRAVVIDQGDFLALELVVAAFLFGDVLYQSVCCHPIGARQGEIPLEDAAIGRFAATIAGGDQGDLVSRDFFSQRESDAGRQGLEHGSTAIFTFETLIALHPPVRGIARFTFLSQSFYAVDTAACIDELHVIGHAIGKRHAVGRVRTGAVHQQGEKLLFGLRKSRRANGHQRGGQGNMTQFHRYLQKLKHEVP